MIFEIRNTKHMNPVYILNLAKEIVYWNSLQHYNTINEE